MGPDYTYRFCDLLFLLHWFQLLFRKAHWRAPHSHLQWSVVKSLGLLPRVWRLVPLPRPGSRPPLPRRPLSPAPPARLPLPAPARQPDPPWARPTGQRGPLVFVPTVPGARAPPGGGWGKRQAAGNVSSCSLRGTDNGEIGWRQISGYRHWGGAREKEETEAIVSWTDNLSEPSFSPKYIVQNSAG